MFGVAVLLGLWAGGVGPPSGGSGSGAFGDAPSDLVGRTFLSTAVTEGGAPRPLVPGSRIRVEFGAHGGLFATTGGNALIGEVDLSGGRITVLSSGAGRTQRGCPPDWQAQEQWLAKVLFARPSWQLSGPRLRVSTEDVVIELVDRRVVDPDRPLEGTRWGGPIALIGEATEVAVSATSLRRVFLVFDQGRVTGSDGCQPLSGPATISATATAIDFGPGPAAAGSVDADPAARVLARWIRAALYGQVRYRIAANRLTLEGVGADGFGVGLHLTATPDPPQPLPPGTHDSS